MSIEAGSEHLDVLVIGAGPTGLACALEAKRLGLRVALVDKGCLCNSIYHYPAHMTFFTTPELLEIGEVPFPSQNQKPNRNEALEYYRKVAERFELDVRQYRTVQSVEGEDGSFRVHTTDSFERRQTIYARKLIVATGYYDLPNYLNVPGEDLSKVMHYYDDPHPYYGMDVLVVGGKNSAAIAALDLWRHGVRVTLVHRGPEMHRHVKYWILPDFNNRVKNGEIKVFFHSEIAHIEPDSVTLRTPEGELTIENQFVFALTGYHPDFPFLRALGVEMHGEDQMPVCDPHTRESNVPGLYLAGVIVAGNRTNEIFIENGRFHGKEIAADLSRKLHAPEQELATL
ncbi:YpdA family putative bacillithiol disulfide reductase [Acidipila sp. EB88]|uniref:YpdA family putative bacillithiol disulfide reductase n=1 Tax=Acidipila sp. EB88 TaxID=2305226 RepID=UPI000F5F7389|nr:YpdA family putative bacillithiol disulfide reductase [Acidipila sp. EB88]RRA48780.1 YpdA family putative bacillithiol disulfide reductase [Acidipila sp. EB88]